MLAKGSERWLAGLMAAEVSSSQVSSLTIFEDFVALSSLCFWMLMDTYSVEGL